MRKRIIIKLKYMENWQTHQTLLESIETYVNVPCTILSMLSLTTLLILTTAL